MSTVEGGDLGRRVGRGDVVAGPFDGVADAVDQEESRALLCEPHRGRAAVPDRGAGLLAGTDDDTDLAVEATGHVARSP